MKLYILITKTWTPFDSNQEMVVRAKSPKQARKIAQANIADERRINENFWLDSKFSSCSELKTEGKEELIIADFFTG